MEIEDLRIFVEVADTGGASPASRRLDIAALPDFLIEERLACSGTAMRAHHDLMLRASTTLRAMGIETRARRATSRVSCFSCLMRPS